MKGEIRLKKEGTSKIRRIYIAKLVGRCFILIFCFAIYFFKTEMFLILHSNMFFKEVFVLHFLWFIWMLDMIYQIIPIGKHISIGSEKVFLKRFKPIKELNVRALKEHIASTTKAAYKVFIIWIVLIGLIGILYYKGVFASKDLFMITVLFYVCDLICVLVWCPFRLIMKNRCCTTCRIFNWDHLMMFTPMIFLDGFFSKSLVAVSILVFIWWELCVFTCPERFWENSNMALKCSECSDKLCTQYCRKLRD